MKWTMKDGKEIRVLDMTEDHARNAIMMLLRTKKPNTLLYLMLKGKEAIDAEIENERKRYHWKFDRVYSLIFKFLPA